MVGELGELKKPIRRQAPEKGNNTNLNLNQKEVQVYENGDECIQSKKQLFQMQNVRKGQGNHTAKQKTLRNYQKSNT